MWPLGLLSTGRWAPVPDHNMGIRAPFLPAISVEFPSPTIENTWTYQKNPLVLSVVPSYQPLIHFSSLPSSTLIRHDGFFQGGNFCPCCWQHSIRFCHCGSRRRSHSPRPILILSRSPRLQDRYQQGRLLEGRGRL